MITVYIISEAGEGMVTPMEFDSLDDVVLFTANIGRNCKICLEETKEKEKND